MTAIFLKNLSKSFGETEVIKNVSLSAKSGEFIALLGPSGCGKSTLLRIVSGLETLDSGEIWINNENVTFFEPRHRNVAMVFQNYALYPNMTVEKNIGFSLKARSIDKDQIRKNVIKVSKLLSIENLLDRLPSELSGGQQQRVAIGRAIVRKPNVFLFDEPMSNLDSHLRADTRIEISRLHRELSAISIYVTHDQEEAMTMADQIVVMKDGTIEQVGTPQEIYNQPKTQFVAEYVGLPRMNFFQGEVQRHSTGYFFEFAETKQKIEISNKANITGRVAMGVRPHNINILDKPQTKCLTGIVTGIEQLGKENIIVFNFNQKGPYRLISDPDIRPRLGSQLLFEVKESNLHFFQ